MLDMTIAMGGAATPFPGPIIGLPTQSSQSTQSTHNQKKGH